ncbi:MAG: ISNCY family transposase [Myxococcaceae bacterium]
MRVKDIIGKAMLGQISWLDAERILGYSPRHIRRLRSRCVAEPEDELNDKRAGRTMPHKVSENVVREILLLREERYFDFNIKHFHEVLTEKHRTAVSYSYVKDLLQRAGYAEKSTGRGKHRKRRERRPMEGMMLHIDASMHPWLGVENGKRDLIYVLDDATSEALYGKFVPEEDTRSCLKALQTVLETRGLFSELYSDRGSHFVRTPKAGGDPCEGGVQFARVLRSLRIRPIYARSPQARGRSERAFRTVQGRLPQELRDNKITNWEEANRYLQEVFITRFNSRFTVEPENPKSAFMPIVGMNIPRACALEHDVHVGADNCIRWRRKTFQIPQGPSRYSYAKCSAILVEYLDGRIDVEYGQMTIARFDQEGQPISEIALEERRATR